MVEPSSPATALTSREIIARVVVDHKLFPHASEALRERPADEESARVLLEAFREGRAPEWLAAHLLGCLRARSAYDVVRGILLRAPGSLAESYAGVALARIDPSRAREDLLRILREGAHRRTREGALYGLGELGDASVADAIIDAVRDALVPSDAAGTVIATIGVPDLESWLRSPDATARNIAIRAAFTLSARQALTVPLASAAREAIRDGTVTLAPNIQRMLEERIDELVGLGAFGA